MNRNEIIEKLTPIFCEVFEDENIVIDHNLTPDNITNWESITHMMLVENIENEFNFKFKFTELELLVDSDSIINLIEKHL